MGLPWVQGEIVGQMMGGTIEATVVSRKQMLGDRPKTFGESGANPQVYQQLAHRGPDFHFETKGFMGGAVAWILSNENLFWLEDRLMERVERHNGRPLPEQAYCALVRNAGAPTIQFCAEPAGGMCEDPEIDWLFDLLDEGLELGVYNDRGYVGFLLPAGYERYQEDLYRTQWEWWQRVQPGISMIETAQIEFLPVGRDVLDEEPGIIVPCFTAGEFSFLKTATLRLEGQWKLRDLECRRVGDGWEPLNRAVACITPRKLQPPMFWRFSRQGGLDECGPHFPIVPGVADAVLSHLSRPLLESNGLGWLKHRYD